MGHSTTTTGTFLRPGAPATPPATPFLDTWPGGLWQLTRPQPSPPHGAHSTDDATAARLHPDQVATLDDVRAVLSGLTRLHRPGAPGALDDRIRQGWVASTLARLQYRTLGRGERGPVLAYLQQLTSYSRAQLTRLVGRWTRGQALTRPQPAPRHPFGPRYDADDLALLAEVDTLLGRLPGPALVRLLQRQRDVYRDPRFTRLGSLSLARLYQLRKTFRDDEHCDDLPGGRDTMNGGLPTWPALARKIGSKRHTPPDGRPGHLQLECALYSPESTTAPTLHLRALDGATQWQLILPLRDSAALDDLWPLLQRGFPFEIVSIGADDHAAPGLRDLAAALERRRAAAQTTQAAPAPRAGAELPAHLEPDDALHALLNLHLPCRQTDSGSGIETQATPLEQLARLPAERRGLRSGITLAALQAQALACSDLDAAAACRRTPR